MPHTDQLLVAAAHSKLDVVQRLVEQDGALMDARSEYGLTALMQVYPSPSARHLVISSSHHRHLGLSKKNHTKFVDADGQTAMMTSYIARRSRSRGTDWSLIWHILLHSLTLMAAWTRFCQSACGVAMGCPFWKVLFSFWEM